MKSGAAAWKIALRLAISVLLLFWIFNTIFLIEAKRAFDPQAWSGLSKLEQWRAAWLHGPPHLWGTVKTVRPIPLLISLVCMGMTIFLGVMRWRLVLAVQGLHLSFGRALEISFVAHFFNSFLLGSTGGDLLKAYYAARETHHKKTEAVMTVFMDRLLGLFAMLLFASLMMIPNFTVLAAHRRLAALSGFILLMMAGCGVVIALSLWGGVSKYVPSSRDWLRRIPKGDMFERALDAARQFGKNPLFLAKALGLSMVLNLFCVWQIMALASGLGVTIPAGALYLIVPVIVCISAIPITPSGLGVRENLYVLMLVVPEINVQAAHALSISLLAYAGSLLWSVFGGIVYVSRKSRDHLDEIAKAQDGESA